MDGLTSGQYWKNLWRFYPMDPFAICMCPWKSKINRCVVVGWSRPESERFNRKNSSRYCRFFEKEYQIINFSLK
jgi:hypothetical protein